MSVVLQQKGFKRFIDFQSCAEWLDEEYEPEEQEVRYREKMRVIEAIADANAKADARDKLDVLFHSDLGRWSAAKAKSKEVWKKEEDMARGCILLL